nr:hypothetical protein [Tanacetum cinerariifolium]
MLSNLKVAGRLLKWRFELEEHDIHYKPRTSVKGQIQADFIVERPKDDPPDTPMEDKEELLDPFRFNATNNEAEYKALIAGLWIAKQMEVKIFQANVDSRLVANQKNMGTWMNPIYKYPTEEILPEEKKKERAIRRKADYVLREIYEGSCSMHAGPRSMVVKALRSGYYWPTMHTDARKLIRECISCQVHRLMPRNPQQNLTPITSPWPFYKWGIDIAKPFSEGPRKVKFMITAIDYFTKWIKAKPMATITGAHVKNSGITHLKTGAKNYVFANASPPLSIDKPTACNGETPFSLTYGTEAVIPVEIGMPTLRTAKVDMIKNDEALEINLDLLEEKREQTAIKEAKSKAKMEKFYNVRLGPKWEVPFEVTEALGKGAYRLRDCNGSILPRTWNVCNLKKCYVHEM